MYRNPNELQYHAETLEAKLDKILADIHAIKSIVLQWWNAIYT
jgi:hypothetical protein